MTRPYLSALTIDHTGAWRTVADGVRFELTEGFPSPVFKTGALNHSTTHPALLRARDVASAEASEKAVAAFAVAAKLGLILRDCY